MRPGRSRLMPPFAPSPQPASFARATVVQVRFGFRLAATVAGVALLAWSWTAVGSHDLRTTGLCAAFIAFAAVLSFWERQRRRRQDADFACRVTARAREEVRLWLPSGHTPDMIIESDRHMVARHISPSSLSLLGYKTEELLATRVADLVHPEDLPEHLSNISDLLAGRRDRVVTTQRCRHRDGSHIWTESTFQLVRDPVTQKPAGFIGTFRDASRHRATEAALREGEAFLRSVIDSSPDCIKVLGLDGDVAFISRNGLCWLGFEEAEVVGRDVAEIWPAPVRPKVRSAIAAAASGALTRFTASTLAANGRPLHLDVLVTPIVGTDGQITRLLAISRDATRATDTENALKETEASYALLADHVSDVVMASEPGPRGRMLYVSPSCRRMLGCEPEAAVKGSWSDLVHRDDQDGFNRVLADVKTETGTVSITHRLTRGDGTHIWAETALRMVERGGKTVVVANLRDVTQLHCRVRDLEDAKQLAERAQGAAEQASQAKSEILVQVSHEIRTPLNSIIGFADLMLDAGEGPADIQRHAELIRGSGSALLTVVNDLLDYSKAEAGAIELESLLFEPRALAQQCADMVRGYAGTKALTIDVEIAGTLPVSMIGDEARLRQILLNLLNNAVKFTPHGQVTLRLATLDRDERDATLRFEVADTGIGIPEDRQHRLFERFSQAEASVSRRFGGSGLGLAICKKLVERMGGTIGVSSRDGWGSTFWFTVTLPLPPAQRVAAPVGAVLTPRRHGRILLVEDSDVNQRLAFALLQMRGHSVDIVADGAEAVAAVAERTYDVVLMDVRMSGMDGMTATRLIRDAGGTSSNVPIIAMTADVYPEQIEAFRLAGMDDHVGKPLRRAQLYATVDRWLLREGSAVDPDNEEPRENVDHRTGRAFDAEAYDRLLSYIGREKLDDILSRFEASLPWRFGTGDGGPEALRRWTADAHVVLSVAGMTGFGQLAAACRTLQGAKPGSEHHRSSLEAARAARGATLSALADLRRCLAAAAE